MYVDIHNFLFSVFLLLFCHIFVFQNEKGLGRQWLVHLPRRCLHGFGGFNLGGLLLRVKPPAAGRFLRSRKKNNGPVWVARRETPHGEGGQQGVNGVNRHLKSHEESEKHFVRNAKQQNQVKKTQMTRRNWAANVVFSGYKPPLLAQQKIEINLGFLRPYAQWLRWPALRSAQRGGRWGRKYIPLGHRRSWLQMMHP